MNEGPDPGTKDLRKFGLMMGTVVLLVFGIFLPWLLAMRWPVWPPVFAGCLYAWSFAHPGSLMYPYRYWMRFARVVGLVNNRIILFLVFYLLLLPTGLLMRLVGRDPMMRDRKPLASYRIESVQRDGGSMEKPY